MGEDWQRLLSAMEGRVEYYVGLGVVVREFLPRMQFVETLNEMLPWDVGQCAVSPGQRILALVEDRRALYRMPEVYEDRGRGVAAGGGRAGRAAQ